MQGVVKDAGTGLPLALVSVYNESNRQSTTSDAGGFYSLPAQQGDNIRFSCVGYGSLYKVKPPSVLIANTNVMMLHVENELKEFTFRASHLSKYQLDSLERQQTYKIPLQRTPPNPFVSPASAIAELFSKKAKRVYQFQENFYNGEIEKYIDTRYTPALVTKLTGLTGDSIGHFMYAYPMRYDFARNATDLELKMWIRSSYKEWLKNPARDSFILKD
jgi:hypothetical protein